VSRLGPDFIAAARSLALRLPGLEFIAPMASARTRDLFAASLPAADPGTAQGAREPHIRLLDGQARLALQAADVALVASGTASLEALLCRCPMVVAYRLGAATAFLLRALRLVRLPYFSLPNLLAAEALVPEFFQEAVRGPDLANALAAQLADQPRRALLKERFRAIHVGLRCGGAAQAADAVLGLIGRN
jgi:lipid-A-disaccharide synthase